MNIVYVISAYKLPNQVVRLVKKLHSDGTYFFIHVDKKTQDSVYKQIFEPLKNIERVFFLDRHICYWGDFGHVKATLKGIKETIKSKIDFDYLILLTGQDYPIKPNKYIQNFLVQNNGKSFISHYDSSNALAGKWKERLDYWHVTFRGKQYTFPKKEFTKENIASPALIHLGDLIKKLRKFPKGLTPFFGSSYWCLSREAIDYINGYLKKNPGYIQFFKYVRVPDEVFFQTILLNSKLKDSIVNDDLFYIDWSHFKPNPAILGVSDLYKLNNPGDLFARKFDSTVDNEIFGHLDKMTENSTN